MDLSLYGFTQREKFRPYRPASDGARRPAKSFHSGAGESGECVLFSDTSPLGIEGVNGQINMAGRRFEIANLTGKAGGGDVSAQGFLVYGSPSNFDLSVKTNSVRLRYPEGLRSVLNSDLHLAGTTSGSSLTGRVVVYGLLVHPTIRFGEFRGPIHFGCVHPIDQLV